MKKTNIQPSEKTVVDEVGNECLVGKFLKTNLCKLEEDYGFIGIDRKRKHIQFCKIKNNKVLILCSPKDDDNKTLLKTMGFKKVDSLFQKEVEIKSNYENEIIILTKKIIIEEYNFDLKDRFFYTEDL